MNSDSHADRFAPDPGKDIRHPALEARLEQLYAVEPRIDLVPMIEGWAGQLSDEPSSTPGRPVSFLARSRRRSLSWLSAVAASLSVLVVIATAASAAGLIDWGRYFEIGFGTERIAEEDLGTDLDLTQQVEGFTVTIGRVYADPYSVAMTVRVTPPDGLPAGDVDLRQATLYDEAGDALGGPGAQGPLVDQTMVRTFYNSGLTPGMTVARYRFEITDLRYAVQTEVINDEIVPIQEIVPGEPCQREPPYPGQPADQPVDETRCYMIASQPLVFDFEVPIGPGVSVAPGNQIASNGSVANVTHVTGGRIGASVAVAGVGPFASVSIETGGQTFPLATYGYACPYDETTRFDYITDQPIPYDTGPWTVRISADPGQVPADAGDSPPGSGTCGEIEPLGDWVFTIDPTTSSTSATAP